MAILKIAKAVHRSRRNERGFTLIEIIVIIVILAIVAAVAVPLIISRFQQAVESGEKADIKLLQAAVDKWLEDHPEKDGSDLGTNWQQKLVNEGYLSKVVKHPLDKANKEYQLKLLLGTNPPLYVVQTGKK